MNSSRCNSVALFALPLALAAACSDNSTTGSTSGASSGVGATTGSASGAGGSASGSVTTGSGGTGVATTGAMSSGSASAGTLSGSVSAGSGAGSGSSGVGGSGSASGGGDGGTEASGGCSTDPGYALQFTGATPDLVQAVIAKLPLGRESRTIELWAWFDGVNATANMPGSWVNEHGLFEYGAKAGDMTYPTPMCHEFGINSTAWGAGQAIGMLHPYGNCNSVDNFFDLPAGTPRIGWLHVSFGYDKTANQFQFTINGSKMLAIGTGAGAAGRTHPEGTWPAETGWNSTKPAAGPTLSIGTTVEFAGPTGWQGKIDELRVWNVLRTETQIHDNMNVMLKGNEPGLIAYYKFDENKGTTMADATGDATNVAKMVGAGATQPMWPKWVKSDIPGMFTCAP